jgi:tripartite-type tricarboxylate transporter receptor subunit TctC
VRIKQGLNMLRRRFLQLAGAAALTPVPRIARADDYPSRPITMIVPFAAGGPLDIAARILAAGMQANLGQTVIIEDVGGAGGSIGVGRAARATPDGYTIVIEIWSNGAIYDLPYDVVNDFAPISPISDGPQIIVGRKTLPADNLKELIDWLKANPDRATAGTAGVGSPQHIFALLFQKVTGTRFQFAHYRGGGEVNADLMRGQIDLNFSDLPTGLPLARAGSIKAFAAMAKERLAIAPEIPTVDEAGLPGFYTSVWQGLWAPKDTPAAIVARLNAAVVAALNDPTVRDRFTALGRVIYPREQLTPQALAAIQKADIAKWWPIIKAAGIKGG